ncbi:MAG: hypothetical protein ABI830_00505 [Pseudolabrys sp.]
MLPDYDSTVPAEPAGYRDIGLPSDWSDQLITIVAASLAILVVAIFALVMGMA